MSTGGSSFGPKLLVHEHPPLFWLTYVTNLACVPINPHWWLNVASLGVCLWMGEGSRRGNVKRALLNEARRVAQEERRAIVARRDAQLEKRYETWQMYTNSARKSHHRKGRDRLGYM